MSAFNEAMRQLEASGAIEERTQGILHYYILKEKVEAPEGVKKPEPEGMKQTLLKELLQPFIDVVKAPRALWGINIGYFLEGLVYFGFLGYLAIHFSDSVFLGVPQADVWSHDMVAVLTAGITLSMLFLGAVSDKKGVRFALLVSFVFMIVGRALMSAAPTVFGMEPSGLWSALHLTTMGGILIIVVGYGMYQPAAYAAVRQFTTPKTQTMGFAMLYALMNLGGYLPTYAFLLRDKEHLNLGIPGTFWVYTSLTGVALVATFFILRRRTVDDAIRVAKEETARIEAEERAKAGEKKAEVGTTADVVATATNTYPPMHMWLIVAGAVGLILWRMPQPWNWAISLVVIMAWASALWFKKTRRWLAVHPFTDGKFTFFILALIPVQTLFTYNWLVLPQYISRSYEGWIGDKFEFASNLNPILIFVLVPVIAALTQKKKVYNMMIWGTLVMSAPAFLLAIGPYPVTLFAYLIIMSVGEAMWQPRFLQYAAQIAPKERTGQYMGVAQFPWFLTKVLVPILYSGYMMENYVPGLKTPAGADKFFQFFPDIKELIFSLHRASLESGTMWLIYGCIAISSTVILLIARPWLDKMKTQS
ncbi:MAG: MFS transporter [Candidatus Magasanikbacteria bacterium]